MIGGKALNILSPSVILPPVKKKLSSGEMWNRISKEGLGRKPFQSLR